jgi:hypothetical protein
MSPESLPGDPIPQKGAVVHLSYVVATSVKRALGHRLWRRPEPRAARSGQGDWRTRARSGPGQPIGLGLAGVIALIPIGLRLGLHPVLTMLSGLPLFGVVFALASSVHSYLVLAYSDLDRVSQSIGFY